MADIRQESGDAAPKVMADDVRTLLAPLGIRSWRGASGREYQHVCFRLIGCPNFASGTYVLVRRLAEGRRSVLAVGHTESPYATVNLARIRETGARLGADEVHLLPLFASTADLALIVFDLAIVHAPPHMAGTIID